MRFHRTLIAGTLLGTFVALPAHADFKRIKSEAEFRKMVVGKTLANDRAQFVLTADGKSTGKVGSEKWVGAWVWHNDAYCSNGRLGKNPELGTKCHFWEIDGSTVRMLRDRGKGDTITYRLK